MIETCIFCDEGHEVEHFDMGPMKVATCPNVPRQHVGVALPPPIKEHDMSTDTHTPTTKPVLMVDRTYGELDGWRHTTYQRPDGKGVNVSLPPYRPDTEHPAGVVHDELAEAEMLRTLLSK